MAGKRTRACPTLRKSSRRIFVLCFIRRTCFASRLPARKYFADFRGNKSIFLPAARIFSVREIYRCTWRDVIDTIRHSVKVGERDGESISAIKMRRSTKIHSTRRSSLSPYLLCNTKYTLGIENLHSPLRNIGTSIFPPAARTSTEYGNLRFLDMFLSIPSAIQFDRWDLG